MIFKQYRYEPLGQASYLVASSSNKQGFVIDPIADLGPDFYVLDAADLGVSLAGVLETHVHADYISCAREISAAAGVPHYLHESLAGRARYSFATLTDGQELTVGEVRLRVVYTPGHTPEHVSYLVFDASRGEQPWFVLTGDSLMAGDVGRPDLLVGDERLDLIGEEERARTLYLSVKERLFTLPDHVEVYPNHFGASSCGGANLSGKAASTIGLERLYNLPMAQPNAEAFAEFVKATSREAPDDYRRIKAINLGLAEKQDAASAVALNVQAVERAVSHGAIVLDVRPALRFAAGHVPGAVDLQFNRPDLADRALLALPTDLEIIVHGEPEAVAIEAVGLLVGAGFRVAGYLRGGWAAWEGAGKPVSRLGVLSVKDLHDHIADFQVIDARERHEYRMGHIEGAFLLPSSSAWATASIAPHDLALAVHCGDVARSGLVASILTRAGRNVSLVAGGMNAWREHGYPEVRETADTKQTKMVQ
jgi:hydroxyacylglutathione hydrolase